MSDGEKRRKSRSSNGNDKIPMTPFVMAGLVVVVGIVGIIMVGSFGNSEPAVRSAESREASAAHAPEENAADGLDARDALESPDVPMAPKMAMAPSAEGLPTIETRQSLELNSADFPRSGPIVLGLKLGLTHDAEPLSVRIAAVRGESLKLEALPAGEDGSEARIEIPRDFLEKGQYLIIVRVRERSHMPSRRFSLMIH